MTRIKDIQDAITLLLHNKFPEYKIILEQYSEVTCPSLFVLVRKYDTKNYLNYQRKRIMVAITYTDTEINVEECNEVNDKLDELFGLTLQVKDRFFHIEEKSFYLKDFVQLRFYIEFNDTYPYADEDNKDKIEEVNIETKYNVGKYKDVVPENKN